MQGTRLPLRTWLRATLALQAHPTLSARQLQTELRVTYKTAWRLHTLIQPRLPTTRLARSDLSRSDILNMFGAVISVEHATSAQPAIAGRSARRDARALRRRFAFGSGRLMPREPLEERILRAACAVLVRRGYGAARMADIAAEGRVSLAAVYAHFKNRQDLLLSAIDWANAEGTLAREQIIAADWSATEKLGAFLDLAVPSGRVREEHALYMDLWSRVGGEARLRPMVVRARERWHRYFRAIVAQGVATGEFRPRTDLDNSVAAIVALQTGIGVEAVVQFAWMPDDRARLLLATFVGNELRIDPSRLLAGRPRPTRV
jgi:AcrR family transcriptional regulator